MSETRNRVEESYERMNDVAQVVDLVDHKDSVEESLENRLYTSPILFKDPFLNQILFSQPPQKPPLSPWRNRSKVQRKKLYIYFPYLVKFISLFYLFYRFEPST